MTKLSSKSCTTEFQEALRKHVRSKVSQDNKIVIKKQRVGLVSPSCFPGFRFVPRNEIEAEARRFETISEIQRKSQTVIDCFHTQENDFHRNFGA
ncbi:hypothetical protein NPIL_561301 [Nephila pilipes]|uniref:Uncharacterized protein n=1 Tax=Nephila pilipes TaxID=299642 RepID=A0A8X6QZ24_NEPPI|nr:hypothetical protein NPIL_561301 [Nephila pilipes]